MPTLTDDEAQILRDVLARILVRQRTGELGIAHGLDRFVSLQLILKKPQRALLDSAVRKLGLPAVAIDKS